MSLILHTTKLQNCGRAGTSAVFTILIVMLLAACTHTTIRGEITGQIAQEPQELFNSVASGNKEPWNRYIADDAMYFDEHGKNTTEDRTTEKRNWPLRAPLMSS